MYMYLDCLRVQHVSDIGYKQLDVDHPGQLMSERISCSESMATQGVLHILESGNYWCVCEVQYAPYTAARAHIQRALRASKTVSTTRRDGLRSREVRAHLKGAVWSPQQLEHQPMLQHNWHPNPG